tara:strand:+ start:5133 stop:5942 length:810 start_codon:yes stop_codon:yes gene_type:complete
MLIWKNTNTLDGFDKGLNFCNSKIDAQIALLGSKPINVDEFPKLRAIFRAGISKDGIPEEEAEKRGVIVSFPSEKTINIIFEETASFTCSLILQMLYKNVGTIKPWFKEPRQKLSQKILLVIGAGNIGNRVSHQMKNFMKVKTFDIINNKDYELKSLINQADCISIHIPKIDKNISFIDKEKLSWMKNGAILINTARGPIVDEDALYEELKKSRLFSAFDVYWEEPYVGKLKQFYPDRFFMTPHVASTCAEYLQGCRNDLDTLIFELKK